MANFNISDLKNLSERVKIQTANFRKSTNKFIYNCETISKAIKADDSNLSDELYKLALIYNRISITSINAFNTLASVMENYANRTLQNEEALFSDINKINSEVQSINSEINSIPEIYVGFE